jgi:hypothetical protein
VDGGWQDGDAADKQPGSIGILAEQIRRGSVHMDLTGGQQRPMLDFEVGLQPQHTDSRLRPQPESSNAGGCESEIHEKTLQPRPLGLSLQGSGVAVATG